MGDRENSLNKVLAEELRQFEISVRPFQQKEFQCCADCCDEPDPANPRPPEEFNKCLDKCKGTVTAIGDTFQKELAALENRHNRCIRLCQEEARAKLSDSNEAQVKEEFDQCTIRCNSEAASQVPDMFARIYKFLDEKKIEEGITSDPTASSKAPKKKSGWW